MSQSQAFAREPAFYTTSNAAQTGYNNPDRETLVVVEGQPVKIKHPQGAHQGDYDAPIRMLREGRRWISMVKGDGNVVFYVITCGAGDDDPHSDYARERKQKARALGWFPIASCPISLLKTGALLREHFVERSLLNQEACDHGSYSIVEPCPHARAEREARTRAHNRREHARDASFKDPSLKLIEAQQAQTTALVEAITSAMSPQNAGGNDPQMAELLQMLKAQQDELNVLKGQLAKTKGKADKGE